MEYRRTADSAHGGLQAYLMCLDGNYLDLVGSSPGASAIKSAFLKLNIILVSAFSAPT